jgi:hypothetical protein
VTASYTRCLPGFARHGTTGGSAQPNATGGLGEAQTRRIDEVDPLGPGLAAKYATAESVSEPLRAAARETLVVIAKEDGL